MRLPVLLLLSPALVCPAEKHIRTIAGNGSPGYSPSQLSNPYGLVIGPDRALYICEVDNHVIRRLDLKTNELTTVAGNARRGYSGDGGPATAASLNQPYEIRFEKSGNFYFVEMQNHVVRRVDRKTGIISTVAGSGKPGFGGDGGPAVNAVLRNPHSIAFDSQERLLICDIGNHRIRRVDLKSSLIETSAADFKGPRSIDADPQGNLYLALREGNAVYRIDGKTGAVRHLAGTGEKGYSGDGGPATQARLSGPKGIAWSPDGGVYIADTESHTIRRIDLKSGVIVTAVGDGQRGDGPDGRPLGCRLSRPHGVFADRHGRLYIGDSENHRIRLLQ